MVQVQANYDDMLRRRLVYKDVGSRPGLFCPAPFRADFQQSRTMRGF
jgi:hypothetical protein